MSWSERVLVIAPHADDEVIGAGGLLAQLGGRAAVFSVSQGADDEQGLTEMYKAARCLGVGAPRVLLPPTGERLETIPQSVLVDAAQAAIEAAQPTAVFTCLPSHHQDHTRVHQATLAALRPRGVRPPRLVACYEYPWATLAAAPEPGMFHVLSDDALQRKRAALTAYESKIRPHLDPETLLRWAYARGAQIHEFAAEAFHVVRWQT